MFYLASHIDRFLRKFQPLGKEEETFIKKPFLEQQGWFDSKYSNPKKKVTSNTNW